MIQRKQTVFLLISIVLSIVVIVSRQQWIDIIQVLVALVCCGSVFFYKKRLLQASLCLVALLLVFFWYVGVAIVEKSLDLAGVLPMVEAIFIFLARKGIKDDEKLVRSLDRIR